MVTVMKSLTAQAFASLSELPGRLTVVPHVSPNYASFHVDSIQNEDRSNAEQKRDQDDLGLPMIWRVYKVWRYSLRGLQRRGC